MADYFTPSGWAHVGHLRTVVMHNAVYEGLIRKGKKAKFLYGFDDLDPMDGFIPGLPESFKEFIGRPLSRVPSPVKGGKSLAEFFAKDFIQALSNLSIKPEYLNMSSQYQAGVLDQAIRTALDQADKIRLIYHQVTGSPRPDSWYPFQVICQNCGKIGTVEVNGWDGQLVSYFCRRDLVRWASGCGYSARVSPFGGRGKLPWRVEWAAKWWIYQNDYEGAGKDHYTKGGSRDFARRVVQEVYLGQEPLGLANDFFLLGGKKMSSSLGIGLSALELTKLLPEELIKFIILRAAPNRQIEFDLAGQMVPRLFDRFDSAVQSWVQQTKNNDPDVAALGHSFVPGLKPKPGYRMRFKQVAQLIQMPHIDLKKQAVQEAGRGLKTWELTELEKRIDLAKLWLKNWAQDDFKMVISPNLPASSKDLSAKQVKFLVSLADLLSSRESWTGQEVHSMIHQLKGDLTLSPAQAFGAIYRVFLDRDSGPQAGWFLASLDRDFVIKRLAQVKSSTD